MSKTIDDWYQSQVARHQAIQFAMNSVHYVRMFLRRLGIKSDMNPFPGRLRRYVAKHVPTTKKL